MKRPITLIYGTIAGVATIGYYLLFYAISPRLMLSPGVYWGTWLPFLTAMAAACVIEKRKFSGAYDLKAALRTAFGVYVVGAVIYYLFYYFLYNVFDPGLITLQREIVLENLERYRETLGSENTAKLREQFRSPFSVTVKGTFFALTRSIVGGFVVAFLLALIVRND